MKYENLNNVKTEAQLNQALARLDGSKNGIHTRLFELYDTVAVSAGALPTTKFFTSDQSRELADTNLHNANEPVGPGKVMIAEGIGFDLYKSTTFEVAAAADSVLDEFFDLLDSGVLVIKRNRQEEEVIPLRHLPSVYLPSATGDQGIFDVLRMGDGEPKQISPILIAPGNNVSAEIHWKAGTSATSNWKARLVLFGQRLERR